MLVFDTDTKLDGATTSDDKVAIIVGVENSDTVLPLESITEKLIEHVPLNMASLMTEDFSTTTERIRMARLAALADAVSPFKLKIVSHIISDPRND